MGNFIKLHEYIINLDNINYIDTDYGSDEIKVYFKSDTELELNKTRRVNQILNQLVKQDKKEDKENPKSEL